MKNNFILFGASFILAGVILGAFGAHALRDILGPDGIVVWKTAVHYQFIHGLAVLFLATLSIDLKPRRAKTILALFTIGILLFSGSLYFISLLQPSTIRSFLGPLTPIGGMCFIAGWALVIISVINNKKAA